MVGAHGAEDQFAQHGSGSAIDDNDVIGLGLDYRDLLALPVHADTDLALAVVDASCWRDDEHPWAGLAAPWSWIAGRDLGKRLVDLGGQLLAQALMWAFVVVVSAKSIT